MMFSRKDWRALKHIDCHKLDLVEYNLIVFQSIPQLLDYLIFFFNLKGRLVLTWLLLQLVQDCSLHTNTHTHKLGGLKHNIEPLVYKHTVTHLLGWCHAVSSVHYGNHILLEHWLPIEQIAVCIHAERETCDFYAESNCFVFFFFFLDPAEFAMSEDDRLPLHSFS